MLPLLLAVAVAAVPVAGADAAGVTGTQATTTGPALSFDRLEHDYGPLWEGESRTTTFVFRNTGDRTLEIQAIRASCGCTTTELKKRAFAPGEGDEITVHFDAKGRGAQRKTVTVVSNAGPPVRLTIASTVRQFLATEPPILRFGDVQLGETRRARIRVRSADPSFTIDGVQVVGGISRFVQVRPVPRDEPVATPAAADGPAAGPLLPGQSRASRPASRGSAAPKGPVGRPGPGEHDFEVTLAPGVPWGPLFATVRVTGTGTRPGDPAGRRTHVHDISVSARVFGEIVASDTMIRVSRVPAGEPFRRVVSFQSRSGEPLPMLSATLVNPSLESMTATLEPFPGTNGRRWRLIVEADPGTTLGRVSGSVIVQTRVPGEEQLTFLVAGMIADDER